MINDADLVALMEPVARALLGEPNRRQSKEAKGELRFGTNGSVSIDLEKGVWYDFEANEGGGVLDLIERETGARGAGRFQWLESQGLWTDGAAKPNGKGKASGLGDIVATYDYVSETGDLLYQVVRYEPKTFRQRRPNGTDGWAWKL